jgi:hypothetical protein
MNRNSKTMLTAQPALVGFLYQSQCSINEIVKLEPTDQITFEGNQDLEMATDTCTRSIQFKYLASKNTMYFDDPMTRSQTISTVQQKKEGAWQN